jgi:hypothetical protein
LSEQGKTTLHPEARRSILFREINPDVEAVPLSYNLVSEEVFEAEREGDWIFGCFDKNGPRAILNELCAAYEKPYIDLASEVPEPGIYGGHFCVSINGNGCLECMGLFDRRAIRRYLETPERREREDAIYGIQKGAPGIKGPFVLPVNGVIANLAATEFMVVVSRDEPVADCLICKSGRGKPHEAGVERYLQLPYLRKKSGG